MSPAKPPLSAVTKTVVIPKGVTAPTLPPKGVAGALPLSVVTASALRLRAEPATTSVAVDSVCRGTTVEPLTRSTDGLWTQVRSGKSAGWLSSKYLAPIDHPSAPVSPVEEFPWMHLALSELGTREVAGVGLNPRIALYQASSELDRNLAANDERPWCSDFVNWCVESCGIAGTNSAAARSWLDWGRPITLPRRGVITVLSRLTSKGSPPGHHVAFFLEGASTSIRLLGGNQSNSVSVASYDRHRVLGYRLPHG